MTPWKERGMALEATQGAHCDYAAWEEWLTQQETKLGLDSDILGSLGSAEKVTLYNIMCASLDQMDLGIKMANGFELRFFPTKEATKGLEHPPSIQPGHVTDIL